jgi:transcriptional regulator with XRE-family HTH domain
VSVAHQIRRQRLARGLSQSALAQQAAVSHAYISRLEKGAVARPSAALLVRLAQALEIDVETLWQSVANSGEAAPPESEHSVSRLQEELSRLAKAISTIRGLPIYTHSDRGTLVPPHAGQGPAVLTLEDPHVPPRRWALQILDDSLASARIYAGDYVVVDPDAPPTPDSLVVVEAGRTVRVTHHRRVADGTAGPTAPSRPRAWAGSGEHVLGTVCAVVRLRHSRAALSPAPHE